MEGEPFFLEKKARDLIGPVVGLRLWFGRFGGGGAGCWFGKRRPFFLAFYPLGSGPLTWRPRLLTSILFTVLFTLLKLFTWAIILSAVVSTLIAFNVLDTRNRMVWTIADFLYRITEPALRPIRAVVPNLGGVDLSPLIALLLLQLVVQPVLVDLYNGMVLGIWQPLF